MERSLPSVSIVTACLNAAHTLPDALSSIHAQDYGSIESIVVDGGSDDGTAGIVQGFRGRFPLRWSSGADSGPYAAMNKGLRLATGDIVGFLNADDMFSRPDAVAILAAPFANPDVGAVFGGVAMVEREDLARIRRYYFTPRFRPWQMHFGYMPPHPTFFVRRSLLLAEGGFDETYRIGADFELMLRLFVKRSIGFQPVPQLLAVFRMGGISNSSLRTLFRLNQDYRRACRDNAVLTNWPMLASRYLVKVFQFVRRPPVEEMRECLRWIAQLRRERNDPSPLAQAVR